MHENHLTRYVDDSVTRIRARQSYPNSILTKTIVFVISYMSAQGKKNSLYCFFVE